MIARQAARRRRLVLLSLVTAGNAVAPAGAQLQEDAPTVMVPPEPPITTARSIFVRDEEIAVADRMLPAFSAQGFTVGAFDLYPGLAIGGLYTSNIFANNADKHGDFAVVIRPELTVRTSSGPYQLEVFARGDLRHYAHFGSENSKEGLGGVQGNVAIGALSYLTGGISYGSFIDPRFSADSPVDAAKPLQYTGLNAYGGGTIEGANTRVVFRTDVDQLRFGTTPSIDGGTLFTKDRDRTRYQGLLRLERALSPSLSVYSAGTVNIIDYRLPTTIGTRDSKGFGAYIGANFAVTRVIRGDVRVGYIRQNFNLAHLRPIAGIGALGTIVYSPNRLWTLTAHGQSTVEDSGVPGSGGYLHRGGSLRADNELRRYIILSLEGGYFRDSYRGIVRTDRLPYADVGATYLSRHHWNARLGYRYLSRRCDCTTGVTNFDDHRVSATLTFQQ